jgi:CRISPR-associated protein Csd2
MTAPTAVPVVTDVTRRHDFVLLFDVTDGNPNGDPDAGNLPRVDPETMQGLVTDVAIKRKVRDWVDAAHGTEERHKIYVQSGLALNAQHGRAYTALGIKSTGAKQKAEEVDQTREWMCANFFDIRMFGAVMTTKVNCGQVRGPLQLTFARSIDAIVQLEPSITRIAVTREEDANVVEGDEDGQGRGGKRTEMGRKALVPYGLYRAHGFFTPRFAQSTGATTEDLELFWQALRRMWDLDRSASRGLVACRGLFVFSHTSGLGNASAHELFDLIEVRRREGVEAARSFREYAVMVDERAVPAEVTLTRLVG